MMKVLLLSHGNLAREMYETASMIFGDLHDVSYLTLPYGTDLTVYKESVEKVIKGSDHTLVLVDLFGGSPFMISSQFIGMDEYKDKMEIVTGMNLSMVLEVACRMNDSDLQELKETAINAGIHGVCDLKERLGQ
jgi:mannose/fructose/sorbose-specific phosphotransferase system IIA component